MIFYMKTFPDDVLAFSAVFNFIISAPLILQLQVIAVPKLNKSEKYADIVIKFFRNEGGYETN